MLKFHPFYSFSLKKETAYLWHIELDKLFNNKEIDRFLSVEEQERANRFVFDIHRARYRASRFALKTLLSNYLSIPAKEIVFELGQYGKPYLKGTPFYFNMSHSGNHALIGVSLEKPIGVDIECFSKRDYLGIARHSFSRREQAALVDMNEEELIKGFFRIWTQKEAFIKLLGRGLHYPLGTFSVSPEAPQTLLCIDNDDVSRYLMDTFDVTNELYGAVCLYQPNAEIIHHRFDYPLAKELS